MKNPFYIFVLLFVSLILQTTLIPSVFTAFGEIFHWQLLSNLSINLVFLIFIYICFSRTFFVSFTWFFVFVLMQNTFDVPWKGSLALSYLLILIIISLLQSTIVFQYSLVTLCSIFAFVFIQNIFHLMLGSLSMGMDFQLYGETSRLWLISLFSCLLVPPVFWILYLVDSSTIFHFDKSKSFFGRRVGL